MCKLVELQSLHLDDEDIESNECSVRAVKRVRIDHSTVVEASTISDISSLSCKSTDQQQQSDECSVVTIASSAY
eukprot:gene27133-33815_t